MWPEAIPRRGFLLAPLCLAACGFAPAYGPGAPESRLRGRVAVQAPDTPDGFRLQARLEDRLGAVTEQGATLLAEPIVEATDSALDTDGDASRSVVRGRAPWRLTGPSGAVLAQGEAHAFTGASVTGNLVAVRAAEVDARGRLMGLLADAILAEVLLSEALP